MVGFNVACTVQVVVRICACGLTALYAEFRINAHPGNRYAHRIEVKGNDSFNKHSKRKTCE